MTTYAKVVGGVLRIHRIHRGIELNAMSAAMGFRSLSGWSRVETGDTTPTVEQVHRAARYFGVTAHALMQEADTTWASLETAGEVAAPQRMR